MWRLFIVILRNSGRTMRRKKDISIGISPCPYNPLIDNKSNELLILLSNMYLLLPAKVFPTRECVAWKLHCCLLSDPLWFWSRAEAGSRYNGGHWRRIIRTSASGLSGLQHSVPGVVRGQGRNSQLFSVILPTSQHWCALKRTRTFSDNIKGTYAWPGSAAV